MKKAKIHIRRSGDGRYYFTLNAKNGKVLMTSEMYNSTRSVFRALRSIADAFNTTAANNVFDEPMRIHDAWIEDHTQN